LLLITDLAIKHSAAEEKARLLRARTVPPAANFGRRCSRPALPATPKPGEGGSGRTFIVDLTGTGSGDSRQSPASSKLIQRRSQSLEPRFQRFRLTTDADAYVIRHLEESSRHNRGFVLLREQTAQLLNVGA
jgi:hypothetical protein